MTLISDTLHYRPDGTVSSVTRVRREAYRTPSGREVTEDVSSSVTLNDVAAHLDSSYARNEERHAELEQQIIEERVAHAEEMAAKEAEVARASRP